jgi:phosphate transport system permease protein
MTKKTERKQLTEGIIHGIFLIFGLVAVGVRSDYYNYLIVSGVPAIKEIGLWKFIFGVKWAPTSLSHPMALYFYPNVRLRNRGRGDPGVPIGFFTAVYIAKVASKKVKAVIERRGASCGHPVGGIRPGGMLVWFRYPEAFRHPGRLRPSGAIIVLAVMILPSIIKVSVTSLEAVPKEYEDASWRWGRRRRRVFSRSVPAAKSGIAAAVVLGVGRAIGEAMAVMMVAGNVPNLPAIFQSVRFLTTAVASEMSYAAGLQRQALFSIALVLFFFIMLINATLNLLLKRSREK